jgi:hypothetical protein
MLKAGDGFDLGTYQRHSNLPWRRKTDNNARMYTPNGLKNVKIRCKIQTKRKAEFFRAEWKGEMVWAGREQAGRGRETWEKAELEILYYRRIIPRLPPARPSPLSLFTQACAPKSDNNNIFTTATSTISPSSSTPASSILEHTYFAPRSWIRVWQHCRISFTYLL